MRLNVALLCDSGGPSPRQEDFARRPLGGSGRILLLACLPVLFSASLPTCLRIEVPPPLPAGTTQPQDLRAVRVRFTGRAEVHRRDFAVAHPASRAVFSRLVSRHISNRTGSVADLLRPALEAELRNLRPRGGPGRGGGDASAQVLTGEWEVTDLVLEWRPPQEFIQTPQAKRPGRVRAQVAGVWKVSQIGLRREFRAAVSEPVFPGQEGPALGRLMGLVLEQALSQIRASGPSP